MREYYDTTAVKQAMQRAIIEGIKLRQACISVGGEDYYKKLHAYIRRMAPLSVSFLDPLFKVLPQFKEMVEREQELLDKNSYSPDEILELKKEISELKTLYKGLMDKLGF